MLKILKNNDMFHLSVRYKSETDSSMVKDLKSYFFMARLNDPMLSAVVMDFGRVFQRRAPRCEFNNFYTCILHIVPYLTNQTRNSQTFPKRLQNIILNVSRHTSNSIVRWPTGDMLQKKKKGLLQIKKLLQTKKNRRGK